MMGFRNPQRAPAVNETLRRSGVPTHTVRAQSERSVADDGGARPEQLATALLMENLTAEQRRQYATYQHFDVTGGESGKRYRIWHCHQQNIEELDRVGHRICIWCVHPVDVTLGDVLLAQKTAIELFESESIGIARQYSDFASRRSA
jgi:hypothetical protein